MEFYRRRWGDELLMPQCETYRSSFKCGALVGPTDQGRERLRLSQAANEVLMLWAACPVNQRSRLLSRLAMVATYCRGEVQDMMVTVRCCVHA